MTTYVHPDDQPGRTRPTETPVDVPRDVPAQSETIPGPTYDNPNEDEHYTPPDGEDASLDELLGEDDPG